MAKLPPPGASISSADRLERVEAKIDRLLSNDTDEQVAGVLGTIKRMLEPAWVQRGIQVVSVLLGILLLSKLGLISGQQQDALTRAATAGLLTAPASSSAPPPAPEAQADLPVVTP